MLPLNPSVEKELLTRLRSGDGHSFEQLYDIYSNRIYGRLLKLTQSEELADELLQDTFVILWEKRHTIDTEQSVKAWLYKVAENNVFQLYRKIARDKKLQEHIVATFSEAYTHTEEEIFLKESSEILHNAINQLSPQRKEVFTMCKLEGRSYEEVAGILGISTNTVSSHLVKATHYIRKILFDSKENIAILIAAIIFMSLFRTNHTLYS